MYRSFLSCCSVSEVKTIELNQHHHKRPTLANIVTFLRTLVQRVSVEPASPQTQHQSICKYIQNKHNDHRYGNYEKKKRGLVSTWPTLHIGHFM
jgi:hypothetical protein